MTGVWTGAAVAAVLAAPASGPTAARASWRIEAPSPQPPTSASGGGRPAGAARNGPVAGQAGAAADDDLELDPVEPDFSVITLPTGLRLPQGRFALRITHRFDRALGQGSFGGLAADLFGFDAGAQVGLELRFGLLPGTQVGVYRTSDRTLAVFAQHDLVRGARRPLGMAIAASVEGLDNFGEDHSPRIALVLSRRLGTRGVVYAVPAVVGNTGLGAAPGATDATWVLGLGARLRLGAAAALVAEAHPRVAGFEDGDAPLLSFGLEWRVGGHSFQINVSNDLGTTPAQTVRGRRGSDDWFIGFNLSRKFF